MQEAFFLSEPHMNTLITKLATRSYEFYKNITLEKDQESSEMEELVGKGMSEAKNVILDFGNGIQRPIIAYDDSIFIDTGSMMNQLYSFLKEKVQLKKQKINNLRDLPENIIFNCTGLGSKKLLNDEDLSPMLGHLFMLKNQEPNNLQYMLIANFHGESSPCIERTLDFFPKNLPNTPEIDTGVLGGTFFSNPDLPVSHTSEFQNLIRQAKIYFYGEHE